MNRFTRVAGVTAGAVALATALAGTAFAATPPWQNPATDPNNTGTLRFYNASGVQITSGSTSVPVASYVEALGLSPASGHNLATLYAYTPNPGLNPGAWSGGALSGSTTYPNGSAPGPLGTDTNPVVTEVTSGASADRTLDDYATNSFPNTSTAAGYQNVYELRVKTSGPGGTDTHYASADVLVDPSAHTWTQIYPTVTAAATTTSLAVSPTSTANSGDTVTLTSTSTAPGTITFKDGTNVLGTAPTSGSSNTATYSTTAGALGAGTHSLTATLAPTQPAQFSASTSSPVTFTYQPPAQHTSTAVTVSPGSGAAYSAQQLTATVTNIDGTSTPVGSVQFSDSVQHALGTATVNSSGTATLSVSNLGAGNHQITATFNPTNSQSYVGSTGTSTTFTLSQVGASNDSILAFTVAPGGLLLTTPYGSSNPLNLGTTSVSADGTWFVTQGAFGDSAHPANGLTLNDSRAGNPGWTLSALLSSPFTDPAGDQVPAQDLALTGVTAGQVTGNGLLATDVVTHDIAAFSSAKQTLASAPSGKGDGSVYLFGTLAVRVPSSTPAGTYTATVTFTAI